MEDFKIVFAMIGSTFMTAMVISGIAYGLSALCQ
jgi:hypothetical protein